MSTFSFFFISNISSPCIPRNHLSFVLKGSDFFFGHVSVVHLNCFHSQGRFYGTGRKTFLERKGEVGCMRLGSPRLGWPCRGTVEERMGGMNRRRLLWTGLGGRRVVGPGIKSSYRPKVMMKTNGRGPDCQGQIPALPLTDWNLGKLLTLSISLVPRV